MKKYGLTILALVLSAGVVFAGSSGISNTVKENMQPRVGGGDGSLQYETKLTLDNLISWADTTEDALADATHTNLTLTGPIQQAITGTGYSLNLLDVQESTSGGNTRGLRVNVTAAAAQGDMQGLHSYLDFPATPTINSSAAIYPLSGWLDVADTAAIGSGNVIAGVRVIVDPNNNDMSALSGGGESALFYGQTWASTGKIEHGLRVVAGAGTYIKNMLSIGGSGTFGTVIDITECGANTHLNLFGTGLQSAGARPWKMSAGDATTSATVGAAMGATCGEGSVYWSTTGKGYIKAAHTGVDSADWVVFTTSTSSAD